MIIAILIALVVFGMIFGSFANAMIWRLHAQEEIQEKLIELQAQKKQKDTHKQEVKRLRSELSSLSMVHGRSMCSNCKHPLAPKDLVPLFSWLALRGKCRYCNKPIDDTPWLEALLPVAFVLSYVWWPLTFTGYGLVAFLFWLVFLIGFAILTVYDLRWQLLPDRVVWPLVGLALIQVAIHALVYSNDWLGVVLDAVWGVVTASGIFYVLYVVSQGEWIGGGDVKLGIALGLLVGGPLNGLVVLFIASTLGTIASLPQLVHHKMNRKSAIPFGPFLMIAAWILVLFSQRLVDWFENFLLLG